MGRHHHIALPLLVLATACMGPAPTASGIALNVTLPGPIVPKGLKQLYPTQETLVTIEAEGQIWIEIRGSGLLIESKLFPEDAAVAELGNLIPGRDYTVGVFAGIFSENDEGKIGGVIRFAHEQVVDIPPDETVTIKADLILCDTIENLSDAKKADCDPTFGTEIAPPESPVVFPFVSRTGCTSDREEVLHFAGTKPENAIIESTNDVKVVSTEGVNWLWDPFAEFAAGERLSINLKTAHDFDEENESKDGVQVDVTIEDDRICFNPYKVAGNDSHVKASGDNIELTWTLGSAAATDTTVQALVIDPVAVPTQFPSSDDLNGLVTNSPYTSPATAASNAGTASFPRPDTTVWELYMYVQKGDNWEIEGAFRYDESWAVDLNHRAAP